MNKTKRVLLVASIMLAMAFTFSCSSSDDVDRNGWVNIGGYSSSSSEGLSTDNSSSSFVASSSSLLKQSSSSSSIWHPWNPNIDYGELIDERDGKVYRTVVIGEQTWMAENLNYYAPAAASSSNCYYNNDSYCNKYGRLYNWFVAMNLEGSNIVYRDIDSLICNRYRPPKHRGVCPSGWHIPSNVEWDQLLRYIYMDGFSYRNVDGYSMSESQDTGRLLKATSSWNDDGNGQDTYGFAALPGGYGSVYSSSNIKSEYIGDYGIWFSSCLLSYNYAYVSTYRMSYNSEATVNIMSSHSALFSVRCVQD
jgi:uncharacterized protein (TIGR02145 family)